MGREDILLNFDFLRKGPIKQSGGFQQNTEISTGKVFITFAQNTKTADGRGGEPIV